jgi:myosin heavy subunit
VRLLRDLVVRRQRDTLARAAYERNFDAIVNSVNAALLPDAAVAEGLSSQRRELFIGLLDIFGSEVLPVNGFEQLMINYANDKCALSRGHASNAHSNRIAAYMPT